MRYPTLFLMAAVLLLTLTAGICAQTNPTMVEQQRDADRESTFALFNDFKRVPLIENQRRAYQTALEYLRRFSGDNDSDTRTVRNFVAEFEGRARQGEILRSYGSKNYPKTFEIGRAILQHDPENFMVLSVLTQAGIDNAQAGNTSLNDATLDYAKRAIQLLEAGHVTLADPFKNLEFARGYLNVAVAALLREKSPAEAAQAYRKAVQSDSSYRTDPLIYHRLGAAILKGEFAQLSQEYNEKYGSQSPSPAQQAMFARINKLATQALDAYARAVALSDPARPDAANGSDPRATHPKLAPELRNKIIEQLTALYKGFHNNSDAGLSELIATVLSKPLP